MFSVVPNILLAPNMTQNAERKHSTQTLLISDFVTMQSFGKSKMSFERLNKMLVQLK